MPDRFPVVTLCGSMRFLDTIQRLDLADEVLVVNVGGYVGESTSREITHARSRGIPVRFLEPATD